MTAGRPPRLGRGLASLLGETGPTSAATETSEIDVTLLEPNPDQPRAPLEPTVLDELTESVRIHGILQPLLVRRLLDGRHQIVAGERRWRAAKAAGLAVVPCLVQTLNDRQSATAALVENLQRTDLNAIEEALGFQRLLTHFSMTQDAIADVVGKSRSHVANTLRLLKLPVSVQTLLRAGALSAGHARALLAHPEPLAAAQQIIDRQLSVRQAEAMAERGPAPDPAQQPEASDPSLSAIEKDLAESIGMAVRLRASRGRGTLTLKFTTLDQLDFLIAQLGQAQRRF